MRAIWFCIVFYSRRYITSQCLRGLVKGTWEELQFQWVVPTLQVHQHCIRVWHSKEEGIKKGTLTFPWNMHRREYKSLSSWIFHRLHQIHILFPCFHVRVPAQKVYNVNHLCLFEITISRIRIGPPFHYWTWKAHRWWEVFGLPFAREQLLHVLVHSMLELDPGLSKANESQDAFI